MEFFMREIGDAGRSYFAVGVIANNGSNGAVAGQNTYLVSTSDWFVWDGESPDHAARFATQELAMAAALSCLGPLFRMPHLDSIHAVETHAVLPSPP